jgi:hypothetical protein
MNDDWDDFIDYDIPAREENWLVSVDITGGLVIDIKKDKYCQELICCDNINDEKSLAEAVEHFKEAVKWAYNHINEDEPAKEDD